MAIFNNPLPKRELVPTAASDEPLNKPEAGPSALLTPAHPQAAPAAREAYESLIAPDLTVEGKIQGAGHIRVAGRFKGDVQVEGDLTLENGAKIQGAVQARKVTIAGELEGNIEAAAHVEVAAGGAILGDIKAGQVTVAPGARLRGHVDFGWDDTRTTPNTTPKDNRRDETGESGSDTAVHFQPGGAP